MITDYSFNTNKMICKLILKDGSELRIEARANELKSKKNETNI